MEEFLVFLGHTCSSLCQVYISCMGAFHHSCMIFLYIREWQDYPDVALETEVNQK